MNAFILLLVVNAAWQVPLCFAMAWTLDQLLLRRWPSVWRVRAWRGALLLSAILPLVTAIADPVSMTAFRIPVTVSSVVVAAAQPVYRFPWTAAIYAGATAFFAVRLVRRWLRLRHLNADNIAVPVAFGILKPQLLLPTAFCENATERARKAAVAHESVHIRERDYGIQLACEILTLPVAFHPVLTLLKRHTADAVEMRCDEAAAREFSDPKDYTQGLLEAACVLTMEAAEPSLAASFLSSNNTFEERIMNLIENKKAPGRLARVAMAVTLTASATGLVAVSTGIAAAQQQERTYKVGEDGTQAPKVLYKTEPQYSESARDAKISGTTTLQLEISRTGEAENIHVLKSLETTLDDAAIAAIKEWKFAPATRHGEAVRVTATIEVNFKLQ